MAKLWTLFALPLALFANEEIAVVSETPVAEKVEVAKAAPTFSSGSYKSFTGRINGNHVRLRIGPDLESHIVQELGKDDLIVVTGQKGDFYEVAPLPEQKAYIFRSFILDGVVEGNRVNVRLNPDIEAPIIGHFSSGTKLSGDICKDHHKWLEIAPPAETRFFIAKEYVEHIGGPELKGIKDERKASVNKLLESADMLVQTELKKPFSEIDLERMTRSYQTIMSDYVDFPKHCEKAKKSLAALQENYLNRKIAYLENRAEAINNGEDLAAATPEDKERARLLTDRMKIWQHVEEAIYLTWSGMHHAKSMDEFYAAQKLRSTTLTGIIEAYTDPVKCKPGDYILRQDGVPSAYLYSTSVNLQALVGKKVTVVASARDNHSFAFPAYYVLEAQ